MSRGFKGRGIGGRLLRDMLDHLRGWGTRRVLVLTDDLCDRGFYEHMGFSCASSNTSRFDNGTSLTSYAYVLDLRPADRLPF